MKIITCDCGQKLNLDYNTVERVVMQTGFTGKSLELRDYWDCECGQRWYQKAKEPKEVKD